MHKADVVNKVSAISGIAYNDCEKVLSALEKVLSDELSSSKGGSSVFDKIYNIMSALKGK